MLLNVYKVLGVAACLTFGVGAARGWKVPSPAAFVPAGGSSASSGSSSGSSGFFYFGGGRSSSGSSGWGGGK